MSKGDLKSVTSPRKGVTLERFEVKIRCSRIFMHEGLESTRVKEQEGKREARARDEFPDPEPKSAMSEMNYEKG